jgi:hypothetical protein
VAAVHDDGGFSLGEFGRGGPIGVARPQGLRSAELAALGTGQFAPLPLGRIGSRRGAPPSGA